MARKARVSKKSVGKKSVVKSKQSGARAPKGAAIGGQRLDEPAWETDLSLIPANDTPPEKARVAYQHIIKWTHGGKDMTRGSAFTLCWALAAARSQLLDLQDQLALYNMSGLAAMAKESADWCQRLVDKHGGDKAGKKEVTFAAWSEVNEYEGLYRLLRLLEAKGEQIAREKNASDTPAKVSSGVRQPTASSWPTALELRDAVKPLSLTTFARIRDDAGIELPVRGGAAQKHRYSPEHVSAMIEAAHSGGRHQRIKIATQWKKWSVEGGKNSPL
jgi:hypothetical protein